jgi:hypothetical protein
MLIPEGAIRWALLSLGFAIVLIAVMKTPRAAWLRHRAVAALGVCAVVAIVASEVFDFSATIVAWVVGIPGAAFIVAVIFSSVSLFRTARANAGARR